MQVSAGWWSPATEPSGSEWCAVRALAACVTVGSQHSGFRATMLGLTALLSIPTAMFGTPTSADMSACFRPDMPMVRSQQLQHGHKNLVARPVDEAPPCTTLQLKASRKSCEGPTSEMG